MKPILRDQLVAAAVALAALGAVGGCDRTDHQVDSRNAVEAAKKGGVDSAPQWKASGATAAARADSSVDAAGEVASKAAEQLRVDDALIVAKVTTGLAADKNLSALKINVDAHAGVVTLRGPAPSTIARARAEEIARNVQGVTSVNNQLNVHTG